MMNSGEILDLSQYCEHVRAIRLRRMAEPDRGLLFVFKIVHVWCLRCDECIKCELCAEAEAGDKAVEGGLAVDGCPGIDIL